MLQAKARAMTADSKSFPPNRPHTRGVGGNRREYSLGRLKCSTCVVASTPISVLCATSHWAGLANNILYRRAVQRCLFVESLDIDRASKPRKRLSEFSANAPILNGSHLLLKSRQGTYVFRIALGISTVSIKSYRLTPHSKDTGPRVIRCRPFHRKGLGVGQEERFQGQTRELVYKLCPQ